MGYVTVYTAAEVTDDVLKAAAETEEWFNDRPIEWDEFWDRLDDCGYFVGDTSSPAAKKIERYVRGLRAEASS